MRQDRIQIEVIVRYGPTTIVDGFGSTEKHLPADTPLAIEGGMAVMGRKIGQMFAARFPATGAPGTGPSGEPPLG